MQFSMSGSYPYHKTCYKESYHPKCDICKHYVSISCLENLFTVSKICLAHHFPMFVLVTKLQFQLLNYSYYEIYVCMPSPHFINCNVNAFSTARQVEFEVETIGSQKGAN